MALILINCSYAACGQRGWTGDYIGCNTVTHWMVFVLPILHHHIWFCFVFCKIVAHSALITWGLRSHCSLISWRFGSICLKTLLLTVFYLFIRRKIRSTFVTWTQIHTFQHSVEKFIHTCEESFWGPITCQQLHRSWIESQPESHSQHQQARQLKKCSSNYSWWCKSLSPHESLGQSCLLLFFPQTIKILFCSCFILSLQWLLKLNACFQRLPEMLMHSLAERLAVWNP